MDWFKRRKKCPGLSNYQKMLVVCFLDPFGHFPTFCGLLPLQVWYMHFAGICGCITICVDLRRRSGQWHKLNNFGCLNALASYKLTIINNSYSDMHYSSENRRFNYQTCYKFNYEKLEYLNRVGIFCCDLLLRVYLFGLESGTLHVFVSLCVINFRWESSNVRCFSLVLLFFVLGRWIFSLVSVFWVFGFLVSKEWAKLSMQNERFGSKILQYSTLW